MTYTSSTTPHSVSSFMYAVYAWMTAALSVSAATAYYVANTPKIFIFIYQNQPILFMIFLAQLALVFALSTMIMRISFPVAVTMFFAYAVSVGITLSLFLKIYTGSSLVGTFITAAGMFGGMSLYGYFTKRDLTAAGDIAAMTLWGLILSMLVNLWFRNPLFDLVISAVGVVIFSLLTAYDTQKIKQLSYELATDEETISKVALFGALVLYLDFINLCIFLLRFLGKRRQN